MGDGSKRTFNSPRCVHSDLQGQRLGGSDQGQDNVDLESTRRKFIKTGLIGVPIILTFTSRSAWAQTGSGNASRLYGQAAPPGGTTNQGKRRRRNRRRSE